MEIKASTAGFKVKQAAAGGYVLGEGEYAECDYLGSSYVTSGGGGNQGTTSEIILSKRTFGPGQTIPATYLQPYQVSSNASGGMTVQNITMAISSGVVFTSR